MNVGFSLSFMVLGALGILVFFVAHSWPVGVLFVGLFLVYATKFVTFVGVPALERLMGLFRVLTALWCMYLTFAVVVDFSLGYTWPA